MAKTTEGIGPELRTTGRQPATQADGRRMVAEGAAANLSVAESKFRASQLRTDTNERVLQVAKSRGPWVPLPGGWDNSTK